MEGASSVVPGFLAKLWALVDDSTTDDVIAWSRNGQSFGILDEQKLCKELLPKYFKHNNLSSFIRQLNMYGFRKVVTVESGMIVPNTTIEFQHMFFKQGEAHLLENIKRKVSSGRTEDLKSSDDLQKALAEVQEIKEQQIGKDNKLASLKRKEGRKEETCRNTTLNNKALWKEVGSVKQKARPTAAAVIKDLPVHTWFDERKLHCGRQEKKVNVLDPGSPTVKDPNGIVIQDVIASMDDGPSGLGAPAPTLFLSPTLSADPSSLLEGSNHPVHIIPSFGLDLDVTDCPLQITEDFLEPEDIDDLPLELHTSQASDSEDPAVVIDSILNDSHISTQGGGFLNRNEMQDFLNCIEANLEELHSMLSANKLTPDPELLSEIPTAEFPILNMNETGASSNFADTLVFTKSAEEGGMTSEFEADGNKDMQLVQYMGNPLLSLFEDLPSFEDRSQDAGDLLLADLEDEKDVPTYLEDSDDPLCLVAPSLSDDYENPLESFESPLLLEDPNGEYKLFPLLLLSPVANFIEEATEIENTI